VVVNRTIDVTITRLRKKIEPYGECIVTRYGYGYIFEETDSDNTTGSDFYVRCRCGRNYRQVRETLMFVLLLSVIWIAAAVFVFFRYSSEKTFKGGL
jgi:hypothetical protein